MFDVERRVPVTLVHYAHPALSLDTNIPFLVESVPAPSQLSSS